MPHYVSVCGIRIGDTIRYSSEIIVNIKRISLDFHQIDFFGQIYCGEKKGLRDGVLHITDPSRIVLFHRPGLGKIGDIIRCKGMYGEVIAINPYTEVLTVIMSCSNGWKFGDGSISKIVTCEYNEKRKRRLLSQIHDSLNLRRKQLE